MVRIQILPLLLISSFLYPLAQLDADAKPSSYMAQGGVEPDTLDWRRYFPLEVGNVWEYEISVGRPAARAGGVAPIDRVELVSDTVVGPWRYFAMKRYIAGLLRPDTVYVRYDSLAYVVVVDRIEADTVAAPLWNGAIYARNGIFDLSAAFGDTLEVTPAGEYGETISYTVEGGYNGTAFGVEIAARKCFDAVWWQQCYIADIGFAGGGSLHSSWLTYARIGDQEYGTSRFTSTEEGATPRNVSVSVFPNPAVGRITLTYSVPEARSVVIIVLDVTGREVKRFQAPAAGAQGQEDLDVSDLPSGWYAIRLVTTSGNVSHRWFTVVR
jgi:hypothetical protein